MTQLDEEVAQVEIEIAAYEEMKEALERDHLGEWVVFHNRKLVENLRGLPGCRHRRRKEVWAWALSNQTGGRAYRNIVPTLHILYA